MSRTVTGEIIDSLHELVKDQQLAQLTLAGHSLDGFLSGKYALKYPKYVESLVFISPLELPLPPPAAARMDRPKLDCKIKLADDLWKLNFAPQHIIRLLGKRCPPMVTNS